MALLKTGACFTAELGLNFATPAETIAGTSSTLAVNPADLYARENMSAQTGLGLVLSAIPAPTPGQSPWGVNTLGETLHYAPGVGWKIVTDKFYRINTNPTDFTATTGQEIVDSFVLPRKGKVSATHWSMGLAQTNVLGDSSMVVGVLINGVPVAHTLSSMSINGFRMSATASCTDIPVEAGDVIGFHCSWDNSSTGCEANRTHLSYGE